MNELTPLFNRAGELPADNWFQIVPRGEWPHTGESGARRVQVIDDAALDAMVNSFKPKLLVDQEHFSYDSEKSSEAFGWIAEVRKAADGLQGRIEWTDLGQAAITNKRYRFASPVWLPRDLQKLDGARVRPTRLDSVGLTNTPNMVGILPLTNRDPEFRRTHPAENQQHQNTMKSIAQKLRLSADASEEAVLTEVEKLMNRASTAETQLAALGIERDELKNRLATQDDEAIDAEMDARQIDETKRVRLKPVLSAMKNRAERVAFLDEVIGKPPAQSEDGVTTASGRPVLNRKDASTPKLKAQAGTNDQAQAAKIEAEVQDYKIANRCSYDAAYSAVRLKKPELFGLGVRN